MGQNYGQGQNMYQASGSYASRYGNSLSGTILMNCNPMHSGNSGGPWRASSHIIGLNSYHSGGDSATQEFSPYFGSDWLNSCKYAKGCGASILLNGTVFMGDAKLISGEEVIV